MTSLEQRTFLMNLFKQRIEFSKNLHYRLDISMEIQQSQGNEIKSSMVKRTIENWILNESYLINVDLTPNNSTYSHQNITTSYDAKESITKSFVRLTNSSGEAIEGRIDTKEDTITKMNFYAAWHDVSYFDDQFCIFHYLIQHQNDWQIDLDSDNELVNLTTNFAPHYETLSYQGKRLLQLDPSKGFLPVRCEARWEATFDNNVTTWEEHNFIVNKSELIDNVWMPTEITQFFKSGFTPNNSTKIIMKILTMESSKVTKDDIVIKFPIGTEVTDAIQGISYKTNANGEPIESTIQPLYGLDPSQVKLPEPPKRKINIVFIVAGILLIVTALYLLLKKRRNKD
jgi:LPXTG-motif cell wall-anchored protein